MSNYDELKRLQETELEIFKEIHRICQKHGIRYYMIGGTLLGAIRHKGFIPWDDDIDIALPRADYEKFCKVCLRELNDKYFLRNYSSDKGFWLTYSKIEKRNTVFVEENGVKIEPKPGIFVDVFVLDKVKSEKGFFKQRLTALVKYISSEIYYRQIRNCERSTVAKLYFSPLKLFNLKSLFKIADMLQNIFINIKEGFFINYGSQYSGLKETYPIEAFGEPVQITFEDGSFYAPKDSHYVLNHVFGPTYMQLPPEDKRISHKPVEISFGD